MENREEEGMENFSESVELHDKYQFEVKFTYPVDSVSEKLEYNVETFFFIPNNLCVNSSSYSREDFFHDMQKHIRFKTPSVSCALWIKATPRPWPSSPRP
jgi:hypothetical protein